MQKIVVLIVYFVLFLSHLLEQQISRDTANTASTVVALVSISMFFYEYLARLSKRRGTGKLRTVRELFNIGLVPLSLIGTVIWFVVHFATSR